MLGIKLYDVWKEAKGVFVKPKLKLKIIKTPYTSYLKFYKDYKNIHVVNRDHSYKEVIKHGEKRDYKSFEQLPKHKLPVPLWSYVWNSKIRRKLRKYHLSWFPPIIKVPKILTFGIKNSSLGWKSKFNELRFENSPELTFIIFGVAFMFILEPPKGKYCDEFNYWECLLEYIWGRGKKDIFKTLKVGGVWTTGFDENSVSYFSLRSEFLTKEYQHEYKHAIEKLKTINTKYLNVI